MDLRTNVSKGRHALYKMQQAHFIVSYHFADEFPSAESQILPNISNDEYSCMNDNNQSETITNVNDLYNYVWGCD